MVVNTKKINRLQAPLQIQEKTIGVAKCTTRKSISMTSVLLRNATYASQKTEQHAGHDSYQASKNKLADDV